jgi:ABC-type Fe3+-siderophore transport system permease subunit
LVTGLFLAFAGIVMPAGTGFELLYHKTFGYSRPKATFRAAAAILLASSFTIEPKKERLVK